jgi:hypothetical protein
VQGEGECATHTPVGGENRPPIPVGRESATAPVGGGENATLIHVGDENATPTPVDRGNANLDELI